MEGTRVPRVVVQGSLIVAENCQARRGAPPAKRGKIRGFSSSSRRRMISQCARLGKAVPIFITLTYPCEWVRDPKKWKRDLEVFWKSVLRKDGTLSAIWRLEPQERGAPHYHLLVYRADGRRPFLDAGWLAKTWNRVVEGDDAHLSAGTRVEALRSHRGGAFYASKYCAKLDEGYDLGEEWELVGKHWGIMARANLPEAPQHEHVLHSELEQKAVLFTMKELFRESWLKKREARYEREGDSVAAWKLAHDDWAEMVKANEHFGNTTRCFGTAEMFIAKFREVVGTMVAMAVLDPKCKIPEEVLRERWRKSVDSFGSML